MGVMTEQEKLLKERIDLNIWDKFEDFLKVYNMMKEKKWFWHQNIKCKYVELRIDMRDGGCIIMDREGNRILPEQLEHQYNKLN